MRQLDRDVRREYEQAIALAPHLVREESPFLHFLQIEEFNPERAATRLAMYWKSRKDLFGERWLLPLTQTGNGALSIQDCEILRTGYAVLFKRPNQAPVLLSDMSRLPYHDARTVARIWYYLAHVYRDDESLRTGQGLYRLHVVTSSPRPPVNLDQETMRAVLTSLPVRFNGAVVLQSFEEGRERLIESLAFQQQRMVEFRSGTSTSILAGSSVAETILRAQQAGIQTDYIPNHMGGRYDYSAFHDWVRMRISLEEIMNPTPIRINEVTVASTQPASLEGALTVSTKPTETDDSQKAATTVSVSSKGSLKQAPPKHAYAVGTASEGDKSDAESRTSSSSRPSNRSNTPTGKSQKRLDFYQKRNENIKLLQNEVRVYEAKNEALRVDNRRLEELLVQARFFVSMADDAFLLYPDDSANR